MTLRPKRSSRRRHPAAEFEDPLSNYDRPVYADELERSLAEDSVLVMKTAPFKAVAPETPVEDVLRSMVALDIACVLIVDADGKLIGVFSERDVLNKAWERWDKVRKQPVGSVMTTHPVVIRDTDNVAKALNLMAVGGFRHIPILNVDDKVVGIIGPRRITAYLQQYLPAE